MFLGFFILCTLGYLASKAYLHSKVGDSVDTTVMLVSPFVDIEYEGVSSTMSGELTVDGVRATVSGFRDSIFIDRIGVDTPSFFSLLELADIMANRGGMPELPDEVKFLVEGMRVSTGSDLYRKLYQARLDALGIADHELPPAECVGKYGFSPTALAALGYDEQEVSASFTLRNGGTHYSMEVEAETTDMWHFNLSIVLDGNMMTEIVNGAAYRPALRSMELEYTDKSLNGRVQKYCESLGLSKEQTVQAHLDALSFFGDTNGIVFDDYVVEPYLDFLNGKSTILIKAEPSKPVRFSQLALYNPKDVPALLNLSASVL